MPTNSVTVRMDLRKDYVAILKKWLLGRGFSFRRDEDDNEICHKFHNLNRKLIDPKPRTVLEALELSIPKEVQQGLSIIREKVEQGADLTPHLSTSLRRLNFDDHLLNDWGVYHLHLSTTTDERGFVTRTDEVLFARFDDNHGYFIGIYRHGDWSKQDVLKIIHRNWPDTISQYRVKGIIGLSSHASDIELSELRKAGVVTMVEVEPGIVYFPPGGGYMTSGISMEVVMNCSNLFRLMDSWEQLIREEANRILDEIEKLGFNRLSELNICLQFQDGIPVGIEQNTGVVLPLAVPT